MGPHNKMFFFILVMGCGLLGVLVIALGLKWLAGEPDCKRDTKPLACYWESVR